MDKKYGKVRDHYRGEYGGAARSICNSKYSTPKEISIFFHKRSNKDYDKVARKMIGRTVYWFRRKY